MATIYRTAQEYAQELQNPTQKSYGEGGLGGPESVPSQSGSSPATPLENPAAQPKAPQASPLSTPTSAPSAPPTNPYTAYVPRIQGTGTAPNLGIRAYVRNPSITENYAGLFAPLTKGAEKTTQGLQTTGQQFGQAVGARRTYQGIGGENYLRQALTPGGDEGQALELAQGLVGARYEGPQGLDQDTLDALYGSSNRLRDLSGSLATGAGIQNAVRTRTPGLTAGELRYEAGRLQKDPGFQQSRRGVQQDVGELTAQLSRAQQEAQRIGQERVADEADIAAKSRGYVEGRRGEVDTQLDEAVRQAKAYDEALEAAYQKFRGSGNVQDLAGAPGVSAEDLAKIAADPNQQRQQRAQAALQALQEQYKDIEDVPFYEPGTGKGGYWTADLPADWAALAEKRGQTPEQTAQKRARAAERQRAYAAAGFAGNLQGWDPRAIEAVGAGALGPEDYSDIFPLYNFADYERGAYQPTKPTQDYVSLAAGTDINRGAVASQQQRYVHDRASQILSLNDELQAAKPYEKRKLATDLITMLDDQAKELEARKGDLTAGEADYLAEVHSARKKARAAKRRKKWNKLSRVVTDIATLGTYEVARPVTGGGWEGTLTGLYGGGKG